MAGIITQFDAQYAYEIVKTICREVGPGLPGSPQERERAAHIQRELESHLGAGNVAVEEFPVAPWAMLSALPLSALLLLIAAGLNISLGRFAGVPPGLTAAAALAFSILAPLPFTFLFILDYEWIDPLFKQKKSVNVIGALRRPGTGSVKRLLILGGHHDSASENTWLGYLGNLKRVLVPGSPPGEAAEDALLRVLGYAFLFATATWTFGFIVLIALSMIQLTGVIAGNAGLVRSGTLGWVLLAYPILPASVFGLFFNRGRQNGGTVPGAADNLAASALGVAMCRFLVNNPAYIPPETEIRFISFGSEEAGLRGSRRYVARHLAELRRLDARLLNFEVVADPEIAILTSDVNGTVKNSPEMVTSVVAAAQRAGVPYRVNASSLGGGSDAGPFSQAGLKALTLLPFKSPQQMVTFYHQKWDRPEVLSIQPLYNVLKLALEWVRNCGE